jgi:hypothetical protein
MNFRIGAQLPLDHVSRQFEFRRRDWW